MQRTELEQTTPERERALQRVRKLIDGRTRRRRFWLVTLATFVEPLAPGVSSPGFRCPQGKDQRTGPLPRAPFSFGVAFAARVRSREGDRPARSR